jgi:hypothetical protein
MLQIATSFGQTDRQKSEENNPTEPPELPKGQEHPLLNHANISVLESNERAKLPVQHAGQFKIKLKLNESVLVAFSGVTSQAAGRAKRPRPRSRGPDGSGSQ